MAILHLGHGGRQCGHGVARSTATPCTKLISDLVDGRKPHAQLAGDAVRVCGVTASSVHNNCPGLNAIAGWWRVLRERLEDTEPQYFEDWGAFLLRLRRTAKWLTEHRSEDGLALCTNEKQRVDDVIDLDGGGETKW